MHLSCRMVSRVRKIVGLLAAVAWALSVSVSDVTAATGPKLSAAEGNGVSIPRSAFGQEYLLSASLIPQSGAPTSSGLAGKVVHFELFGDEVDLYESTQGLVVTSDLPSRRLITTFPVVSSDEEAVVIDFNAGMRRVFQAGWYASRSGFSATARDTVQETPRARVFDVTNAGDKLAIRQVVQMRSRESNQDVESQQEVRYFIEPRGDSDFEGKEHDARIEPHVRFFQILGQLEPTTGRSTTKIARFDLSEPITFYYSANTPDDYVEAVKEGILYWNKVFGRELVKAARAPEGVSAPDVSRNMVQWVPWDRAGFAYADVLVDPLTGESKRGQAYMTSVFGIGGKARARVLLRTMRAFLKEHDHEHEEEETAEHDHPSWPSSSVCYEDPVAFAAMFADGLEGLLADADLTDEAVLRFSQDYVLNTVAHEVGHVLGLRHNFAGSLATTMNRNELNQWVKDYVLNEDLDQYLNKITSSSVMDYQSFKARAFTGFRMRASGEPLPHDRAAIHWGYYDDEEAIEKNMFFGTDDEVSRWGDVNRSDFGADPVVAAYADLAESIEGMPTSVIESFVRARAPADPRDQRPLASVSLSPSGMASSVASRLASLLSWFDVSARSLRVEREFEFVGPLNEEERIQAHWERLNEQIDALGGIDRAVFSALPVDWKLNLGPVPESVPVVAKIDADTLTGLLEEALDSPAYATFVGADGEDYSFDEEEKALILSRGRALFEAMEEEVVRYALQAFGRATRNLGREANGVVNEDDIVSQFESRVAELADLVMTSASDEDYVKGRVNQSRVEILDFKYGLDTRRAAGQALSDGSGSYASWSKEAKGAIHKKLKAQIDSMLNIPSFKEFNDSMLSRPLRDWYLRQQDILRLVPPGR